VVSLPRFVVAAPASGHGKTTVATGLMAALRAAGHVVSGHKVGPDYIDPGYHSLATGRPGRNLDPHLVGEDLLAPLLLHGARTPVPADIAVIEGVMGLYDGALGRDGFASTAHVAAALGAPVVLVVDVSHASRSVAAVVQGMASFDRRVRVAGVILNKAGSQRHADEVRDAIAVTGIPVLGSISRDDGIVAPSRHLGLVPAEERPDAESAVARLADQVAARVDLEAVVAVARSAGALHAAPWEPAAAVETVAPGTLDSRAAAADGPVVAVAGGRAFTFRYTETVELLHAAGCRTVTFDPTSDAGLPARTAGVYLGGGFPEVHASDLADNDSLRRALAAAVGSGVPTVAECAGLLYLCRSLEGVPMVGALDADARMTPRLTLAYHTAVAPVDTLLANGGARVTGHEFHRTTLEPAATGAGAWRLRERPEGFSADPSGSGRATLHASYLHTHWAGFPAMAARFAAAARAHRPAATGAPHAVAPVPPRPGAASRPLTEQPDLHHHGDREVRAGLVDLAVNVHRGQRPGWLDDALRSSLEDLARYPDPSAAREALARRHLRRADEVLPTAGGAEAFTLVARMRPWTHPVVVHPQFTEPEAALRAAGHRVHRVLLRPDREFRLDAGAVPDEADLVVIGNPTNPTGVLHPVSVLAALARKGRTLVVDEAFMDAVPGEAQSLTGARLPGVVVVRSLTKTWAIPGLRAGYVVGDAVVISRLEELQPPWSVSTPAAAAMVVCSSPDAVLEAARRAREIAPARRPLVSGLRDLGLSVVGDPVTPFVLVRAPQGLRARLRTAGYAVRRGDTFPGLGPDWVRIAVRDTATTRALLDAVSRCLREPDRATVEVPG
jgi:cobyrinic acid a,c-diamide synthase